MIIQRGKNKYCYRSLDGGKKEYLGLITTPASQAFLAAQQQKEVENVNNKKIRTERDAALQEGKCLLDLLNLIGRTSALLHGYYIRKTEIRRINNGCTY